MMNENYLKTCLHCNRTINRYLTGYLIKFENGYAVEDVNKEGRKGVNLCAQIIIYSL